MRWPIRNQILVPFALMQFVTVLFVSSFSAWVSVQSAEQRVATRLNDVLDTLETSSYPLTPHILEQLRKLSGAHLAILDERGVMIATTLDVVPRPFDLLPIPAANQQAIESLPIVVLDETNYFAGYASRQQRPTAERVLVLYPEDQWRAARTEAIFLPLLWGGIVLVLTLLTSIWIARRIARRVQAVQHHVCRISAGDFEPVPHGPIDDELRNLSRAVNQMASALDQSLRQTRDSERATMLTQLASGLAHHLRNALTGAKVSIQLHQRHCSQPEDEAIRVALAQLNRTEEQIAALLRLSRGRSASPARSQTADLTTVLDDVAALVSPLCIHHRVDFRFQSEVASCRIEDADALRGALLNLITNAIEAAGPRGTVGLEAERRDGSAIITVSDNGPGISCEIREEIFVPFFTTKEEGIGIGLPVAKQAVEDCGGALRVARVEDRTLFEITIPAQSPPRAEIIPPTRTIPPVKVLSHESNLDCG